MDEIRVGQHRVTREMSGSKADAVVKLNGVVIAAFQTPGVPFKEVGYRSHEFMRKILRALRATTPDTGGSHED